MTCDKVTKKMKSIPIERQLVKDRKTVFRYSQGIDFLLYSEMKMKKAALSPKDILKIVWIGMCAVLASLVLFIPITTAALMSSTGNLAFTLSKLWAFFMLRATGVRVTIRNRDTIRKGVQYVIISNHQSMYDILALVTSLGIQFRWIIKKELLSVPLFGYALYVSRNIFIDRSDSSKAIESIHKGMDRLPPGTSVMFFAEGTRSRSNSIGEFKKGGFVMAMEKGFPVLPVAVNGSRKILPGKSLVFNSGTIEVVVDDPIQSTDFSRDTLKDFVDATREVIVKNYNPDYPA